MTQINRIRREIARTGDLGFQIEGVSFSHQDVCQELRTYRELGFDGFERDFRRVTGASLQESSRYSRMIGYRYSALSAGERESLIGNN